MHIIAGKLKGKKIQSQSSGLRPTTSIARASLFNIIGEEIEDKIFVDAFSGTGAMGLEAYSRGAKEVWLIEKNPQAVRMIQENVKHLEANARVIRRDVFDFLQSVTEKPFDYIFFSPPFDTIHWHLLMRAIETSNVIPKDAMIIIQHPKVIGLETMILKKMDERRYGFNKLSFFYKGE